MKAALFPLLLSLVSGAAQEITFTNRTVTFTNLEGRAYTNVTLVRADLDGIIWKGDGIGRISFTNLAPALLESWGVPTNRIAIARARAERKGQADAAYKAVSAALAEQRARDIATATAEQAVAAKKAQKSAEQQAAADQLTALQARVDALDKELRHARAMAADDQALGGTSYVKESAVEQLNDLHEELRKMAAAYRKKYGELPDRVTGR